MSAIDFQGNTIPTYDRGDAFVAKLTKSGHQTFFKLAGSNLNDYGNSITSFKLIQAVYRGYRTRKITNKNTKMVLN